MHFKESREIFNFAKKNIPAKKISTFGVGGTLKYVLHLSRTEDIISVIKILQKEGISYAVISGGSNVVFPDGEITKLVIVIDTGKITTKENIISCEAGVPFKKLIETSIAFGYEGMEALSGIPGSVGGAIVGNAGAYGSSISNFVSSVSIFDGEKVCTILKKECGFSYRESIFKRKPFIILSATFLFREKGDKKRLLKKSKEIISLRSKKYKKGLKCPGSFFKNILVSDLTPAQLKKIDRNKIIEGKIPSGYLLEKVGACGMKEGGICVASFHGNLLINKKEGTARDVKRLSLILKKKVRKMFGIELEEEVRYIKAL